MRKTIKICSLMVTGILLFFMISCSNLLDTLDNVKIQTNYTIGYELNGGKWNADYEAPVYYTQGTALELPTADNIFRSGYVFCGWYEAKDFSDLPHTKIDEDTNGKKFFYARWEVYEEPVEEKPEIKVTYTFKPNGGNWKGSTDDLVLTGKVGDFVPIPDYPLYNTVGMAFEEWDSQVPLLFGEEDKTFTAKWVPGTAYYVYHIIHTLDTEKPTELVYTQRIIGTTGGNTEAEAREIYGYTARPITQVPIADDCSTLLEVHYDVKTITYTFKSDGGKINDLQEDFILSGYFSTEITETIPVPCKDGYIFIEWDKEIPAVFEYENIQFNPVWEPIEYEIIYHLNGGTDNQNPQNYTIDTETINLLEPTREQYAFSGWYENQSFTGNEIKTISKGSIGDIQLYAKWIPPQTLVLENNYTPTVIYNYTVSSSGQISASLKATMPSTCKKSDSEIYKYSFIIDGVRVAIISTGNTSYTYDISNYIKSMIPGTYNVMVTVEIYDVQGSYSGSCEITVD